MSTCLVQLYDRITLHSRFRPEDEGYTTLLAIVHRSLAALWLCVRRGLTSWVHRTIRWKSPETLLSPLYSVSHRTDTALTVNSVSLVEHCIHCAQWVRRKNPIAGAHPATCICQHIVQFTPTFYTLFRNHVLQPKSKTLRARLQQNLVVQLS